MTKYHIGCQEPGCHIQIEYTSEDKEVPLYCSKHRTKTGRHSYTRNLIPSPPPKQPETRYEVCCLKRKCRHKIIMSKAEYESYLEKDDKGRWKERMPIVCPKCGTRMRWHRDVKG